MSNAWSLATSLCIGCVCGLKFAFWSQPVVDIESPMLSMQGWGELSRGKRTFSFTLLPMNSFRFRLKVSFSFVENK